MALIQIEVRNGHNAGLLFKPTQTPVRGAIDFRATGDPELYALGMKFPDAVPGQRIVLDVDAKRGAVLETLNLPEHEGTRNRLADTLKAHSPLSGQLKFADSRDYPDVHVPTWLYWMQRAVSSGLAVLVSGDLDVPVEGEPRKDFLHARREDPGQKTVDALLRQNQQLIALLVESLPEGKRARLKDVLN